MTVYALPGAAPLPDAWSARVLRLESLEALAAAAWNRGA
jgi:hypothetical protein